MRPENINTVCHRWLLENMNEESVCIDATMGNGNDTLFLAEHCRYVYAFDIQKEALEHTKERLAGRENVSLFLASHAEMDKYVKESVDAVVFNLGYLPKGDESVTTLWESTQTAVKKALALLKSDKCLFLVFYIGHAEGNREYRSFLSFLPTLQNIKVERTYTYTDRHDAPILYQIRKIGDEIL